MSERLAYSDKEAARILGLSKRSIVYLRRNGKIGFSKIGRRILIPATELQRLLKRSFVKPTATLDGDEPIRTRPPKQQRPGSHPEASSEEVLNGY
jgi:excisionase family DNA binding protein